jgi:hypothetical protein
MNKMDTILIGFWILVTLLWSMNIWGGWAERDYETHKQARWKWFWLSFFNIPISKENCVRFQKTVSAVGIALVSAGTIFTIIMTHLIKN